MLELLALCVFFVICLTLLAMVVGAFKLFFFVLRGFLWLLKTTLMLPVMLVVFAVGALILIVKVSVILGIVLVVAALLSLGRRGHSRRMDEMDVLDRLHAHLDRIERRMRRLEDDPRVAGWDDRPY